MVNNEKINYMHVGMGLYNVQKRGTDENIRKLTYMYILQTNRGKERLEDYYSTSVPRLCNSCRVMF